MADEKENEDREAELRVKLVKRLAVAGVMVTVLLAVLAFFDYLAKPEEPDAPVFTRPVPVPPKKEVTQPVKPNADLPEPPKSEEKPESPPASPEPPPKPEVSAQPATPPAAETAPAKPVTKPAPAPAPANDKTPAKATPAVAAKPPPAVIPESSAAPSSPGTPTAAPVAKASETPPPAASAPPAARPGATLIAPPPTLPRLLSGYVVQAGVFNNAQAAEELHAKLALHGIPSTLEARVSVGPFKSKQEADAAREKLKALGIEGMLIPPAGRK